MKTRPSALIIKDNKILTLKYVYNDQPLYALPGGNVEDNESVKDTLVRELQEELGIDIEVNELFSVAETYNPTKKTNILHLTFVSEITNGTPIPNQEQTTTLGVEWLNIETLSEKNLYPNISTQIKLSSDNYHTNKYLGTLDQKWL
jgi:8-oxo-dGTP diphosphatase